MSFMASLLLTLDVFNQSLPIKQKQYRPNVTFSVTLSRFFNATLQADTCSVATGLCSSAFIVAHIIIAILVFINIKMTNG